MESLLNLIQPLLEAYSGKFGVIITIVSYIGTLRAIMKPLSSMAHIFVDSTASDSDNKKLESLEGNKIYKAILYVLDWTTSIKFKK